ncbi:GPP34-domain-containing protein [Flagelloscypha sp. PMI_526]|nr:GPP34-domain-containing protein [Flagelloscypha sp. PMI_526]
MRRRGHAPAGDDSSSNSPSTSPQPNVGGSAFSFSNAAGGSSEGGHRVAYDPRDLVDQSSEAKKVGGELPKLTLMEEVLLLGLKDRAGYLSFWNDNISYALRGCILIELALRRRIAVVKEGPGIPQTRDLSERLVGVISSTPTGETILDETLKMMKGVEEGGETLSISTWIDLLSGETWNVMKIGFQLKQVRERLAKGLVDKGVLRTEKRNFLLFDMATHPVADARTQSRTLRAVCLSCSAYAASVLDNVFTSATSASAGGMAWETQEVAFSRAEEMLAVFGSWPWSLSKGGKELQGLVEACKKESIVTEGVDQDKSFELVAGVLEVMGKLDSLL